MAPVTKRPSRTIYLVQARPTNIGHMRVLPQHRVIASPLPLSVLGKQQFNDNPEHIGTFQAVQQPVFYRSPVTNVQPFIAQPAPAPPPSPPVVVVKPPIEKVVRELLGDVNSQGQPRKRERLNHLSPEEKLDRRKLKNRVAAQTARDRKKMRSQKLEDVMSDLLDENEKLREECERLRFILEEREQGRTGVEALGMETFGSAAFINAPQPRVQVFRPKVTLALLSLFMSTSAATAYNKKLDESSKILRRAVKAMFAKDSCPRCPQRCEKKTSTSSSQARRARMLSHNQRVP